jgi:hypothetical protein
VAELRTLRNVEILEVGENWRASTGDITITHEHLVSAVAAMDDPAVRAPILKLGHRDGRFNVRMNADGTPMDGQPSFGRMSNLHLSDDGMTLLADLTGVPAWLADALPSAFPRRSFEGWFNITTATGRTHDLVVTGLALLGEAYPAITTLEDIQAIYEAETIDDIEMVAASNVEATFVSATRIEDPEVFGKKKKAEASISSDDIRKAYYDSLAAEQTWWWIREHYVDPPMIIVDDDDGTLYRVNYEASGDSITFGDPVAVNIVYQDAQVAASGNRPVVTYSSKSSSRADTLDSSAQEDALTKEQLSKLGLAEDATPEQIDEALDKLTTTPVEPEVKDVNGLPKVDESTAPLDVTDRPETEVPTGTSVAPAPEGTVTVDKEVLAGLRIAAERAEVLWKRQNQQDRDNAIKAALDTGRIPPARVPFWNSYWDKDPEGAKQTLASLEPDLVPLTEKGHGESVEATAPPEDQYPASWASALTVQGGQA